MNAFGIRDQRCFHRRSAFTPRHADDMRVVSIFGFQSVDHYPHWGQHEMTMPLALAKLWASAKTPRDAAYYGGKWTAEGVLAALLQLPPEMRRELLRRVEEQDRPRL